MPGAKRSGSGAAAGGGCSASLAAEPLYSPGSGRGCRVSPTWGTAPGARTRTYTHTRTRADAPLAHTLTHRSFASSADRLSPVLILHAAPRHPQPRAHPQPPSPPEHRSPAARCRPVPLGHLSPCGRAPGEHPLPLPPAHPHGREAASGRREWGGREAGGAAGRRRPQAARGGSGTCWPPHRTARSGPRGRSTHARSRPAAAERQQPQPAPGGSSYPSHPSSPQALAVPPPRRGMGGGRQPHVCPTCWLHSPELQQHHRTSLTAKSSGGTPWGPQFSACTQC